MTPLNTVFKTIAIAFLFSYAATPLIMRKVALKANFLDRPSSKKVHAKPMPLLGGLAIYFAFIAALSFTLETNKMFQGVLVGATVIMVVGIIDDRFGMMPRYKLMGQIIAAIIAVKMGLKVDFIENPYISIPFTVIWLVGVTNAFNLIDNMSGLAAGIAGISGFFFGTLAFYNGDIAIAVLSFALMASSLGFLPHNFPKPRIFMGDAGSLFLGFMLASIAVAGNWKTSSVTTSLAIPLLILGYPIFDITFVTVTRLLKGDPISRGGKDHSSHRLAQAAIEAVRSLRNRKGRSSHKLKILILSVWEFIRGLKKKGEDRAANRLANLGFKKKRGVLLLYAVSFAFGVAALLMTIMGKYFDFAIMSIAGIIMLLFGIRLAKVKIDEKNMGRIDNLIILSLCLLIIGIPVSNSIIETAAIAAIALWFFKKLFIARTLKIERTPLNTPIFFYLMFAAISLFNSQFLATSLNGFAFKTTEYFLLYFVIVESVRTKSDIKKLVSAVLLSCAIVGIDGLWQYASGHDFLRGYPIWSMSRIKASFKYPTGFGSWLITMIPFCVSLAIFGTKERIYRIAGICLSLLLLTCLALSLTRAAWIALLPAVMFLVWKRGDVAKKMLLAVLIGAILVLSLTVIFGGAEALSSYTVRGSSVFHRASLTELCWRMFKDHPLIGHGLNTFMSIYEKYSSRADLELFGIAYAHNCYFQMAVETGIFGLSAFLWIIAAFFISSLKDINRKKDGLIKAGQIGLAGGLIAYLAHSFLETNLYALQLAVLFYCFLGLAVSLQKVK